MHKSQKCIQILWDHQKKIPFVENYKECAICSILRENTPSFLPFAHRAKSASNNTMTIMECDSCWVPDGQHEPALY